MTALLTILAAVTLTATPATIDATIAAAQPGDTVRLAEGDYGRVEVKNRNPSDTVTIDARKARLNLTFTGSSNFAVIGGAYYGMPNTFGAFTVRYSSRVSLRGTITMSDTNSGINIGRSTDVKIVGPIAITRMTVDGIEITLGSKRVTIADVSVSDNVPDGVHHPDCVQGWSRPGQIVQDVRLDRITCNSASQGIFFGNHVRNGVNDGGFDRIHVSNVSVTTGHLNGILLGDCRKCSITDSTVTHVPGGARASLIRVLRGSVTQRGNVVR